MNDLITRYTEAVGEEQMHALMQLAKPLAGARVVHINSTKAGGGVAEILSNQISFKRALGIDAQWEVIHGDEPFFEVTKSFHNALQGNVVSLGDAAFEKYSTTNAENADSLRGAVEDADFVFVHDPQPAALIEHFPKRKGKWVWRCHIDLSHPYRPVWKFLHRAVMPYDASIFSLAEFARRLPHPQFIIAPSIDPLSEKNIELPVSEVDGVFERFGIDRELPIVMQVSRFDRFKDPLGVIESCRIARRLTPHQLVLAGGDAVDDPEGAVVLEQVHAAAKADPYIHVLLLPSDAHRTINALQRAATVVMQKSIREGFGLTVTEAMWKHKAVIGGDTGGIRLQVVDHQTGFLVRTPEGAALRLRYLLAHRDRLAEMGETAHSFVRENFLITRHVKDYLSVMLWLSSDGHDRIELF
jgi:trehalose synthase